MSGFVEGIDRSQSTLFPPMLDDYVGEDNPVRAVDAFVEGLDLGKLGFGRVTPLEQGRPGYDPATLLKIYIYGYLNRIPSSRRLERECQRNIELIWLTGQLAPDFKTIADFRKDNGKAIREVCRSFVALCRELDLLSETSIADAGDQSIILILSGINLPGMSGLELLPKAKAMRPDVPIIMITAYGDAETKRKALENGAEALLTKPIDFGTLRTEIDSRVERAA